MISLLPEELRLTSVLCAHLFLFFSGNSLLFLTNLWNGIKNQNGCSCQYTHVKKTNEKEFTAQSATTALLWRRFLCVEHNQRQNRRICKAATIQPNSRLKYQPQKLHSWKHKCTTAMELTGNRPFWRANALRRDGRPWTFVSVIHRPQRKDSAKEKCSTFNKYVQCQNTRKE